ncbi:MAG: amidohydrolase family protein, partial [Armatimonadetes bacterium]|nr:amidohydrolase family protein [Armatimonadota bacterium]
REPRSEPREDPVRRLSDPPAEVLTARHAEWVENSKFVVKAHELGLKFAFSSDGDRNDLLANVRKHIALGLPKAAALRALTIDAAEILGVADQLGSLAEGKLANIVLMSGDFADEESVVKTVFVAGKKIEVPEDEEDGQ